MPMQIKNYPANWREISRHIRFDVAKGRCQCTGECGLHHGRRCVEMDGQPAIWARGKVMLTAAHLDAAGGPCQCAADTGKKCGNPEHLKAMCQRCHCRMDAPAHAANA